MLMKVNTATGLRNCEGMTVGDEPNLIVEMYDRQAKLTNTFRGWRAEQGIKWLFGYANYVNQNYYEPTNKFSTWTYTKGTILLVDFFGGFGNELIYDHPAIVLSDLKDGLIIAPLTSTPTVYTDAVNKPLHIRLIRKVSSHGNLNKNSTIKLDQLRYISKKRILEKIGRVSDREKLNEIEKALMTGLANFNYNKIQEELKRANQNILDLTAEKVVWESEKISLIEENKLLNEEIASLKLQLKEHADSETSEVHSEV